MSKEQLSVDEVAEELGCSAEDVRELIRKDELRPLHCGIRPGLVPRREVDAFVRRRASGRSS